MRTEALFTLHQFGIPCRIGKPVWICPVGDIHRDSEHHADGEWRDWLKYARTVRKDAWFLGMGDYLDFLRAHNRALMHSFNLDAPDIDDAIEKHAKKWLDVIYRELKPIGHRFIGMLSGNHFYQFRKEGHSDRVLAEYLNAPYLGTCAGIVLTLNDSTAGKRGCVRIIAHHGVGGAGTIGGSLNRVQRFLHGWEADIALMGDDHKRGIMPTGDQLRMQFRGAGLEIQSRTQYVGRTGSFLRGYVDGKSGYVTDKALTPTSLGTVELELTLQENGNVKIRGLA